ncbi:hypothetical protein Y032_0019g3850 [Ancylostoma ceylanicum]|uniref:Uncharacterized protein n=1 Tax=Ancylostoma ceylanicum TaxID=53326 RepID=A0A016V2M8_9BILA|nr:hypothetical protein Y032_0019g3850 [Ancylostoma ceylanicum]
MVCSCFASYESNRWAWRAAKICQSESRGYAPSSLMMIHPPNTAFTPKTEVEVKMVKSGLNLAPRNKN